MADDTTSLLTQEYLFLQKTIEDYDARALTIKAWSVTFSAAGLGLAYQQGKPALLLIAAASALVFWLIETVWKVHQYAFFPRIRLLEQWFAGDGRGEPPAPCRIFHSWRESMDGPRKVRRWFGRMFCWNVLLPHALVVAAGLLLYGFGPGLAPPR